MVNVKLEVDMGDLAQRLALAKQRSLAKTAEIAQQNFKATTKTWDEQVNFTVQIDEAAGEAVVGTDNDQYAQVNDGFEHILKFSKDFEPKTFPFVLDSFLGKGEIVGVAFTPRQTEPRQFDLANAEAVQQVIEPITYGEYGKLFR